MTAKIGEIARNRGDSLNNDNVSFKIETNNDNVQGSTEKSKGKHEIQRADTIADKLVEAFNNPSGRAYYCKVAYKLSESAIWQNYEQAIKGNSPTRLFTWLCQRALDGR